MSNLTIREKVELVKRWEKVQDRLELDRLMLNHIPQHWDMREKVLKERQMMISLLEKELKELEEKILAQ